MLDSARGVFLELYMTKTLEVSAVVSEGQCLPVIEPQRGACVEFVEFFKEQHLGSRAAHTFLRMFHNKAWNAECDKIREAMRPEVDRIFAPAEKALQAGANCTEVLQVLVKSLKDAEDL
jgi:hypothetical protein